MSSGFLAGILFVAVCVSCLLEGSIAAKIQISPGHRAVTKALSVDIACMTDRKDSDFQDPVILQIKGPKNNDIVSFFQDKRIVYGANIPNRYRASGDITQATLTLTITEPQETDFGEYICRLTYLSDSQNLKTHEGKGTLTEDDIESVITTRIGYLFDRVSSLESTVKELSRKESTKSAFLASTNKNLKVKVGKSIAFPDIKMAHGLVGYDKSTGVYIAPVDGLYVFHLVISLDCKSCYIIGYLKVNTERVAGFGVHDLNYYDQSAVSSTVSLKKGDRVYAVPSTKDKDSNVGYGGFSTFSGFLLEAF